MSRDVRLWEQLDLFGGDPAPVVSGSVVDLFAGPGGWSEGLRLLGRAESVGVDWDRWAVETARAAGHPRVLADVSGLDPRSVASGVVEGVIASPPCEGFSLAGAGRGRRDSEAILGAVAELGSGRDPRAALAARVQDPRSVLVLEPLRWVLELGPEWTAWEQVPGVLPLWRACADVLRSVGYQVWTGMVRAETLGVPQTRKRAILRARRGELGGLRLTHSRFHNRDPRRLDPGVLPWVSMAEALGWGMPSRPSFTVMAGGRVLPDGSGGHGNSGSEWGSAAVREQIRAAAESGDVSRWVDRAAVVAETGPRWVGTSATDFDLSWPADRPSTVVTGRYLVTMPGANANRYNGATKSRNDGLRVSVQEAAILQSFRPEYRWRGSRTVQYRQVGDAVPPVMAAAVLASVGAGSWQGVPMTDHPVELGHHWTRIPDAEPDEDDALECDWCGAVEGSPEAEEICAQGPPV